METIIMQFIDLLNHGAYLSDYDPDYIIGRHIGDGVVFLPGDAKYIKTSLLKIAKDNGIECPDFWNRIAANNPLNSDPQGLRPFRAG